MGEKNSKYIGTVNVDENNVVLNRVDFVSFIECVYSNPNGDPDNGNYPRLTDDGYAVMTDVCIKRKIRDYIEQVYQRAGNLDIYVAAGEGLQEKQISKIKSDKQQAEEVIKCLCDSFFDIRAFGAALTAVKGKFKNDDCSVTGPIQFLTAYSVEPVTILENTITRCAPEKKGDAVGITGTKYVIPYAIFRLEGHYSPYLAKKTGFSFEDLEVIFESVNNMFSTDMAAARPGMDILKTVTFKHDSELGNAKWTKLRGLVECTKLRDSAHSSSDYEISIDNTLVPEGVCVSEF